MGLAFVHANSYTRALLATFATCTRESEEDLPLATLRQRRDER
jgi:hypothetical protein